MRSKLLFLGAILCALLCFISVPSVKAALTWSQTYGGADTGEVVYSLIATADGGYALAGSSSLVKTDASGNMQWNRTYGGTENDVATSVIATSDGGYAIAGGTSSFGPGNAWLIKTDELGVYPEYTSLLAPAIVLTITAFILISKKRLLHKRTQEPCR